MVKVRIQEKPIFKVLGRKTWISGTNNEQFGEFWQESHKNGLINTLKQMRQGKPGLITNSTVIGISCVEADPSNRSFFFYIAAEASETCSYQSLKQYVVPAAKWAIFESTGEMPSALIKAEIYAFSEWLPNSKYVHANAPELEVYPFSPSETDDCIVEFWLPIIEK